MQEKQINQQHVELIGWLGTYFELFLQELRDVDAAVDAWCDDATILLEPEQKYHYVFYYFHAFNRLVDQNFDLLQCMLADYERQLKVVDNNCGFSLDDKAGVKTVLAHYFLRSLGQYELAKLIDKLQRADFRLDQFKLGPEFFKPPQKFQQAFDSLSEDSCHYLQQLLTQISLNAAVTLPAATHLEHDYVFDIAAPSSGYSASMLVKFLAQHGLNATVIVEGDNKFSLRVAKPDLPVFFAQVINAKMSEFGNDLTSLMRSCLRSRYLAQQREKTAYIATDDSDMVEIGDLSFAEITTEDDAAAKSYSKQTLFAAIIGQGLPCCKLKYGRHHVILAVNFLGSMIFLMLGLKFQLALMPWLPLGLFAMLLVVQGLYILNTSAQQAPKTNDDVMLRGQCLYEQLNCNHADLSALASKVNFLVDNFDIVAKSSERLSWQIVAQQAQRFIADAVNCPKFSDSQNASQFLPPPGSDRLSFSCRGQMPDSQSEVVYNAKGEVVEISF